MGACGHPKSPVDFGSRTAGGVAAEAMAPIDFWVALASCHDIEQELFLRPVLFWRSGSKRWEGF